MCGLTYYFLELVKAEVSVSFYLYSLGEFKEGVVGGIAT